jgi:hypothetical protein
MSRTNLSQKKANSIILNKIIKVGEKSENKNNALRSERKRRMDELKIKIYNWQNDFDAAGSTMRNLQTVAEKAKMSWWDAVCKKGDFRTKYAEYERLTKEHTNAVKEFEIIDKHFFENVEDKETLRALIHVDKIKSMAELTEKCEHMNKLNDRLEGEQFDINKLRQLPEDVVRLIFEYLPYDVRSKYLTEQYNPFALFNRASVRIRRAFMTVAFANNMRFIGMNKKQRCIGSAEVAEIESQLLNDKIYTIIYQFAQDDPKGTYFMIRDMCLLFKKNKKYRVLMSDYQQKIANMRINRF